MAVTMKDVAEHAGVSKSTVSQYLNNRFQYMSEETKTRIANSISELKYTPNQIARSLKQKKTNVVAVVAATLSSRFTTELVSAIEKFFSEKGVDVIVASTDDNSKKERNYVESLKARQVDGVIVFPTIENRDFYVKLVDEQYPIVFVDRKIENVAVDSVTLNNFQAGFCATNALLTKNHQNIAILTFPLGTNESIANRRDRLNGYIAALTQQNIAINSDYIIQTDRKSVNSQLNSLLALPTPPTALVLTNDMLLEQTLIWSKQNDILLPDTLSLVGIDDVSFAHFFSPSISTVEQPVTEMGTSAAELLLNKINNEKKNAKPTNTVYEPLLNLRESIKQID
ncbi:LacI family transcriptional regulator, kdg operon repressor [Enterococcus sp. AZ194]|uniref:LacI family DNA-binding transcriptional regulator n=1 Tax=Enterococcus sp. AZ194 TaxID=2774629 RepID=UPI003F20F7D2